jgi:lysozyme family protein
MAKWTYEATKAGYTNLWRKIEIKKTDAKGADRFARKIIDAESRYKKIEASTGVPWFFIGALHMRESGCNFAGVLHNGEHIIGTGKKTKLVPKGRGPFTTWENAAIDALRLKDLHKVPSWDVARMGFHAELFNGTGYIGKGVNSAYLWAGSNLEQKGKYVADHVWDKDFDDPQIGVMTVLKRLCELRPDIASAVGGSYLPPPPDVEPVKKPKPETKPAVQSGEIWATIGTILTTILGVVTDWRILSVLVVAFGLFVIWRRYSKDDIKGLFSK